jgi:hypothetical protein
LIEYLRRERPAKNRRSSTQEAARLDAERREQAAAKKARVALGTGVTPVVVEPVVDSRAPEAPRRLAPDVVDVEPIANGVGVAVAPPPLWIDQHGNPVTPPPSERPNTTAPKSNRERARAMAAGAR